MTVQTAARAVIESGFAAQQEAIELEFQNNEAFRSLCEEYEQCSRAIDHWRDSDSVFAVQREQEYADLLVELHQEIRLWVEKSM